MDERQQEGLVKVPSAELSFDLVTSNCREQSSLAGWLNILMLFVLTTFGAYTGALIVRSYNWRQSSATRCRRRTWT